MGKVVEIRVHGVGGTPPEHLLGESSPDDVVRIAGSGESAFYRRTDDHTGEVEGYAWGRLTSKGILQPLWILLLPFTLANVAGWMLPAPGDARRPWAWKLARAWVYFLGGLLTVGYAFSLSIVVVKQAFYQWGSTWSWWILEWLADHPAVRVVAGGVLSAGVGTLFALTARRTQRGFEAVNGAIGHVGSADRLGLFEFKVPGVRRLEIDKDLREQEFWSRGRRAQTALKIHWLVWIGAVVLFTGVAAKKAGVPEAGRLRYAAHPLFEAFGVSDPGALPPLGLEILFASLGVTQLVVLVLLLLTLVAGFRDPKRMFLTGHFRAFGPCVAFATAVALAAGFFSALATVTGRALRGISSDPDVIPLGGPEYDLDVAFGLGTLTFLVALAGLGALRIRHGSKIAEEIRASNDPPANMAGSFDHPNGVPRHRIGGLGTKRALALAIRKSDLALSLPAIPFAIAATWTLLAMFEIVQHPNEADLFGKADALAWFDGAGSWVTLAGVTALGGVLLHGYFKDSQRRTIGILWDVLTFWPRRFHSLAVRPYAERAVPELQCRIVHHLNDPDTSVIVSAHSQGTVLAYAALVQLAEHRPELARRVCLVTYGSPLTRLHSCFFPGYFDPPAFSRLAGELRPGAVQVAGEPAPVGWRNFYRLTDYIGQRVEFDPAREQAGVERNVLVDDPPSTPPDVDPAYLKRPDPLRPAWIELVLHSDYNSEIVMKEWDQALRGLSPPDAS